MSGSGASLATMQYLNYDRPNNKRAPTATLVGELLEFNNLKIHDDQQQQQQQSCSACEKTCTQLTMIASNQQQGQQQQPQQRAHQQHQQLAEPLVELAASEQHQFQQVLESDYQYANEHAAYHHHPNHSFGYPSSGAYAADAFEASYLSSASFAPEYTGQQQQQRIASPQLAPEFLELESAHSNKHELDHSGYGQSFVNLDEVLPPPPQVVYQQPASNNDLPESVIRVNFRVKSEQQQAPTFYPRLANNNDSGHASTASSTSSEKARQMQACANNYNQNQLQLDYSQMSCGAMHNAPNNQQLLEPELKVCEWEGCDNTFLDMQEFVKHLEDRHVNQTPEVKNRYFCLWSNCKRNEQEFNARYKLLIHMRVHSGEKPYPCSNENCKKSFSRLENLKIHVRSHTGEKPYKCNFERCSKSFTNSSDRIKHHKTHKDPKPYACTNNGCTKRYTDPSSLRKHLRAHRRQAAASSADVAPVQEHQYLQQQQQQQSCLYQPQPVEADYDPSVSLISELTDRNSYSSSSEQSSQYYNQLPDAHNDHSKQLRWRQHNQLSQSWCAGSTRPLEVRQGWAERAGRCCGAGASWRPNPNQLQPLNQLQGEPTTLRNVSGNPTESQWLNVNQQQEALMRSLPPGTSLTSELGGNFRTPYSNAGWLPDSSNAR